MGSRYYRNFAESTRYVVHYIDVDERWEFQHWFDRIQPAAVVWNYYPSTLWWLSDELIDALRPQAKQVAIFHEVDISGKGFDLILHQDPNPPSSVDFPYFPLPRSIPAYDIDNPADVFPSSIPRFGSFGFGIGGKGFDDVVRKVCAEYDEAAIHLHIPFAHFGDADGTGARAHAANARAALSKAGVTLTIDHDEWAEVVLLDWLASNTCNCFFYHPHHGRGISGTLDYSLAVKRPLAITHSEQFRHVWSIDDSFTVEQHSLHEIIARGSEPTDKFRSLWSREALVKSFEAALESIGVEP